jgi:hypothetical protein
MELIEKLKDIILENNYFDTLAGERFREWNNIKDIQAVISFAGRSKKRESYRLSPESDSDSLYVTHLYVDRLGEVKAQLSYEDTDDFSLLLRPGDVTVEAYGDDVLEEWIDLLTF